MSTLTIDAGTVHEVLRRHLLVDGLHLVVDLEQSRGVRIRDASTGADYLDFFGGFSTSALGFNHPRLLDPEFLGEMMPAALNKITNSDLYTESLAEFVATFATVLPESLQHHLFFIEGGALAVENTLKAAFDWKRRMNLAAGRSAAGSQILHFRDAFHGRSGYTLSLTNTDPVKIEHFPKFAWPRVSNPALRFPIDDQVLEEVRRAEEQSLDEIRRALAENPHDIAAILIEPIQAEGGDHHFRPEFLRALRQIADESEVLLIFDEVQTGFGTTGRWWCFEHFGVEPDLIAFGKKTQVCGIAASPRHRPDRIGVQGPEPDQLHLGREPRRHGALPAHHRGGASGEPARQRDPHRRASAPGPRTTGGNAFRGWSRNPRGRGFFLAFDLPDTATRDRALRELHGQHLLALPTGRRGIRFRPPLVLSPAEADEGLELCERGLRAI